MDDSKIEINFDDLYEVFGVNETKPIKISKPVKEVPKLVEFIDPKKARSIAIMLAKFRLNNSEIVNRIKQLQTIFTDDQLAAIQSNLPDQSEISQIKEYHGDINLLGVPEKYFLSLMSINGLNQHIELMDLTRNIDSILENLTKPLNDISECMKEINNSKKLENVLIHILKIGNILNGSTIRGGAYGFSISFLSKLLSIKGNQGKSFINFLIEHFEKSAPELLDFPSELQHIEVASKIDLQFIQLSFNKLKSRVNALRNYKAASEKDLSDGDFYFTKFTDFDEKYSEKLENLSKRIEEANTNFVKLLEEYGESPEKLSLKEFLEYFNVFIISFRKTKDEINRNREKLQKQKEKEKNIEQQRGVLDSMVQDLQSSSAISDTQQNTIIKANRSARLRAILNKNC